jgi:phage shock protein PspC (stress-responsive transcriptional regulator)
MKQVIHINYQGRVVPIEQTAFDLLKSYTDSLSIHFDSELGKEEILHDIKDRIAELFDQRLKKGAACITDEDVNAIINSIGRIEDLKAAEVSEEKEPEQKPLSQDTTSYKRLYRDETKKTIGGVCAGLANYLNIDVTVVRVIFAVMFFIFGFGLIPYLVLWAIVPNSAEGQIGAVRKKLYRDGDHKIVAGVCSGISNYFGMEVWVPRLFFLLPLLATGITGLNDWHWFAGFLPGTFITYLICWIGIPEAKTTTEKLEMRGEKVDMNSIQHVIKEEMKGVKERAEKFSKNAEQQVKAIGAESSSALGRFINAIVRIIIVMIKAISYTILTIIGLAMLLFLLGLSFSSVVLFPFKDFMLNGLWQNYFAIGTILFFIILPILAIVVSLIRKIAGIKTKNKWLNISFISLWIVGWISLFGLFSTLGKDFSSVSHRDNNEKNISIQQPTNGKLIIKLKKHPIFDNEENNIGFFEAMELFKDSITIDNVSVKIVRSMSDSFEVRTVYSAHGNTRFAADTTASAIQFHINQQDSLLFIDRVTSISKNQKFRNQQVVVLIGVPEGKTIDMQDCGSVSNYNNNVWQFEDWEMESTQSKEFIMTNEGLKPLGFSQDEPSEKPKEEKKQTDSFLIKKDNVEKSI